MLCYRDRSYCATPIEKCTCDPYYQLTEQDKENAKRLGLPIAFTEYCNPDNKEIEE
jgi:hypothetical protein